MSEVRVDYDPSRDQHVLTARLDNADLNRLRLHDLDKAMLAQPIETAADMLLNFEVLFRRLGEQWDRARPETDEPDHAQ